MKYIDFHAHILPELDHGSPSQAHSLRQLEAARNADVNTIVATPHFYFSDNTDVDEFLKQRKASLELLKSSDASGINIVCGAEIHLSFGLADIRDIQKLAIGDTGFIMFEMPFNDSWQDWIPEVIDSICSKYALRPVIAHIDRYSTENIKRILKIPDAVFQVNAVALCDVFSRHRFIQLVKNNVPILLGSDVHLEPKASYAMFSKSIHILSLNAKKITALSESILNGSFSDVCEQ